MKRFSFITTLFLSFGLLSAAHAAGPDDSFVQAYTLIAEADNLARLGQKNSAIQKYRQARNDLAALQSGYPDWNAAIVTFRIKYVDQKLKSIGAEAPEDAKATLAKPAALDPAVARREIAILKRKVESLENTIILKDAKLKEALSAVPSPEETKQLAKLESDLSGLRQENDNLKGAIDKATAQLKDANAGLAKALPRMFGFQAANAAPLVEGRPIENPQTVATAIRIGNPASWDGAMNALKESNGHIAKVTDEEILAAYKLAARTEGVFAEPASAASLAGLIQCVRDNLIPAGSRGVATLTGHGLKDPDNAIGVAGLEPTVVASETDAVKRVIGL